jgi:hypothetical protein
VSDDQFDGFWLDVVRDTADQLAASRIAVTWPTLDGEVTVDYRPGDFLRVVFADRGEPRTFVLDPEWSAP